MNWYLRLLKGIVFVLFSLGFVVQVFSQGFVDSNTPENTLPDNQNVGTEWKLDFSDEFNGSEVDLTKWTINESSKSRNKRPKIGVDDWFWKPENVWLEDGKLVLQVKKHDHNTMYCGSVFSKDKYETTYGYFEARIQVADASKGTHTAFWLQGQGMSNVDGTANDGAEIDVFESAWLGDYTKCVVHIDGYGANHKANTKQYNTPGIHDGYHTWGLYWTDKFMKIYYDGVHKATYSDSKWVVKADEYLWLSDGASFGIEGDYFTSQPNGVLTKAYVDYIRVWKSTGSTDPSTGNLIENGNFESSSTGFWSESNSDIIISESVYPVVEGSKYCRMPGIPNSRNIKQTVSVEAGEKYTFKLSGRIQNSHAQSAENNHSTKGVATLKGELLNGSEALLTLSTQSNTNTDLEGELTIPDGLTSLTVKISKDWNVAYVDNVKFEKQITTDVLSAKLQNSTISAYPNPARNILFVESSEPLKSCMLINVVGSIALVSNNINSKKVTLNLNKCKKGVYVLKTTSKNGTIKSQKVIING